MGRGKRAHYPDAARLSLALDRKLEALADPHRRRAVELLGERPRRAGELAADLALSAPAVSRHLRLMKACGLVTETHPEFDARVRIYSLKDGALDDLKRWVAETEAMWMTQLSAFKAHVEGRGE